MKIPAPKRWWFPVAFLVGYFVAGAILSMKFMATNHSVPGDGTQGFIWAFLLWGAALFPIGIPGCLIWSENVFRAYGMAFALYGWVLYAALVIGGLIRPSKALFTILVVILLLNIAGCQPQHIYAFR